MFENCKLSQFTNKSCPFCGSSKGKQYCGLVTDENEIDKMKVCGKIKKEKEKGKK